MNIPNRDKKKTVENFELFKRVRVLLNHFTVKSNLIRSNTCNKEHFARFVRYSMCAAVSPFNVAFFVFATSRICSAQWSILITIFADEHCVLGDVGGPAFYHHLDLIPFYLHCSYSFVVPPSRLSHTHTNINKSLKLEFFFDVSPMISQQHKKYTSIQQAKSICDLGSH